MSCVGWGGDVVLVDGPDLPGNIVAATGGAKIALALDGVGGSTTQRLLEALPVCGTVVVWSAMSGEPALIAGPRLVFTGQVVRGFWIVNWLKVPGNLERFGALCAELAPLIASGAIALPIAGEYTLDQYAEALAVAARYSGKAIFRPNGLSSSVRRQGGC